MIVLSAEGKCLCGGLRYAVRSKPLHVTTCHCKFCQRATGGAYLVEPIFDKVDFSVIKGDAKTYAHISEGSGKKVTIHFCDSCGTKLFMTFERFPEVVGIYAGTFDDPNWFDRTIENSKQIFLGVAQFGTIIPTGVKTYDEHAMTNDGTPLESTVFTEPFIIGPYK